MQTIAPVSELEIEAIQTMVKSEAALTPWPFLQTGQTVRIGRGSVEGEEGTVVRSEFSNPRVVVSVSLLQRSVTAENRPGLHGRGRPEARLPLIPKSATRGRTIGGPFVCLRQGGYLG